MTSVGGTATDAFQNLLRAITNKDDLQRELDYSDRMESICHAYGFTGYTGQPEEDARWLVKCLQGDGPKGYGCDDTESPVISIIKLEAAMIIQKEAVFEDSEGSIFFPWMGGRWDRAAICLLSILSGHKGVAQTLEAHKDWLAIPTNLDPTDCIQVLPVLLSADPYIRDGEVMITPVKIEIKNWPTNASLLSLQTGTQDIRPTTRFAGNRSSYLWISICRPFSQWDKDPEEGLITVPAKRWKILSNKADHYNVPSRVM